MMPRAQMSYEAFHRIPCGSSSEHQVLRSSTGLERWSNDADILESRCAARRPTVGRGLKGMICKDTAEAELIGRLADTNGVVDAADHMGIVSFM